MTGFALAILTAFIVAGYNLCARMWVVDSKSPLAFSIVYTTFAAIFSLGILFLEPWQFSNVSPLWILLLVMAGLLYGLYDATQFSARKYVEASTLSLISQLSPVVAFVLAVALLKEDPSASKLTAVLLIICGNLILLFKHSEKRWNSKGLWFGFAAALFTGVAYFVDSITFEHFPMALYAVTVYAIPALVVSLVFKLTGGTGAGLVEEFRRTTWKVPALSLIGVAGFYFLLKTYAVTPLSIAIPLVYSSTALTVLGGIFLLNEREDIWKKIVGTAFVFAGIILLN